MYLCLRQQTIPNCEFSLNCNWHYLSNHCPWVMSRCVNKPLSVATTKQSILTDLFIRGWLGSLIVYGPWSMSMSMSPRVRNQQRSVRVKCKQESRVKHSNILSASMYVQLCEKRLHQDITANFCPGPPGFWAAEEGPSRHVPLFAWMGLCSSALPVSLALPWILHVVLGTCGCRRNRSELMYTAPQNQRVHKYVCRSCQSHGPMRRWATLQVRIAAISYKYLNSKGL